MDGQRKCVITFWHPPQWSGSTLSWSPALHAPLQPQPAAGAGIKWSPLSARSLEISALYVAFLWNILKQLAWWNWMADDTCLLREEWNDLSTYCIQSFGNFSLKKKNYYNYNIKSMGFFYNNIVRTIKSLSKYMKLTVITSHYIMFYIFITLKPLNFFYSKFNYVKTNQ